jgi:hypothetical protein
VRDALRKRPFSIHFKDDIAPEVNVIARLGEEVYPNENEDYCPLIVEEFSAFML